MSDLFRTLHDDLLTHFRSGAELDDAEFDELALRVHHVQRQTNPVLERFWSSQAGVVRHWEDIPPVPTRVFKEVVLKGPGETEAVFLTSGTTRGSTKRGAHHVTSLELYRASAEGPLNRALLPSPAPSQHLLALVPDPSEVPESSLGRMIGFLAEAEAVVGVTWGWDNESGLRLDQVTKAVEGVRPVLVATTAFGLVGLLDLLEKVGPLPHGSSIMETGGFKGRVAVVSREDLYRRVEEVAGVDCSRVVNEYGMTELLSQAYDGVVGSAKPVRDRRLRFPPWVRTRVLDPATLRPVRPGERGLLCHMDLANLGSACPVLTEDIGVVDEDGGLVLYERLGGAEPRGCSLMAEAFLRSGAAE